MRRLLGTLAVVLVLAGCGDDTTTESPPAESPDATLVHATAAGGHAETRATDVTDDADLAAYVEQFEGVLAAKVTDAARNADGDVVLAQVVAVGCDVPPGAHVEDGTIVPERVPSPMEECFAPVTTVAVAGVPG